ncbi:MAG TPA: NAD-dependent epimerase/dehydratase family protein [Methylovirgula sp.]|nr:NAD-dependent epimerase/dehydratase family protein [Methylovirgula sp.]
MNFFGFGLGYTAQYFLARYGGMFDEIAGTVRSYYAAECLKDPRIKPFVFDSERADPAISAALAKTDVLLVSIPPGPSTDPVLAKFGRTLIKQERPRVVIYLSTIGVYGDRGGEWVDETRVPIPKQPRSIARLRAEKSWAALARDGKIVHLLRLAGIYGPGRNALVNLREGRARRIIKEDQVFNRIHVADASAAIAAAIARQSGEIWNIADDEPAPPQDVISYAAELMGIAPPPEETYGAAELSEMQHSFYEENKRASNRKMKEMLGVSLSFPTYREGLAALWAAGEGRG